VSANPSYFVGSIPSISLKEGFLVAGEYHIAVVDISFSNYFITLQSYTNRIFFCEQRLFLRLACNKVYALKQLIFPKRVRRVSNVFNRYSQYICYILIIKRKRREEKSYKGQAEKTERMKRKRTRKSSEEKLFYITFRCEHNISCFLLG
jgi:hypothetical protein